MIGRSLASIFNNARSVEGSVPMTFALKDRLSFRVTSNISAPSITWLLVTIYPSVEIITPDPIPTRGWGCILPLPLCPKKNSKKGSGIIPCC